MTTTALVVLWYNHPELWDGFAELAACAAWDELVVIDNGSAPEVHAFLTTAVQVFERPARVVAYPHNECVLALNAGMATVTADLLVTMPNDYTLTERRWWDWATAQSRPGVVQGPLANAQLGPGHYAKYPVVYLDGPMVMWRQDWQRLGGWDEGYQSPGYWGDVDFCWRAQMAGMALRLTRCGMHHIGGATTGGTPDAAAQARWLHNRSRFWAKVAEADRA